MVSYLSGFINVEKPHNHTVLFFEIIKQKFLEALDKYTSKGVVINELGETRHWLQGS